MLEVQMLQKIVLIKFFNKKDIQLGLRAFKKDLTIKIFKKMLLMIL